MSADELSTPPDPSPPKAEQPASSGAGKIERVIGVPLSVTLRFGQRHLTLREVLALSTGSLVELDRQVEEPVELVLGDRVLAKGEVVIVDGNYGLRITEVVEDASLSIQRFQAMQPTRGEANGATAA